MIIIIISIVEQNHVWFTMGQTQSEEILKQFGPDHIKVEDQGGVIQK